MWNKFLAISTLIGTIIGAGIFGLPYAALKSGFVIFILELVVLFFIVFILHLFYGEVVIKTSGKHRLVGYVEKYLGKKAKKIAFISSLFGLYGTLLVFLSLGGKFTATLFNYYFSFDNYLVSSLIFYFFCAMAVFFTIRWIVSLELFFSGVLFLIILILTGLLADKIVPSNLEGYNIQNIFLPYGIILFALSGATAIPELKEIIHKDFFKIIFWGTFIPAVIYFVFTLSVLGFTGAETSKNAIDGLLLKFGNGIIIYLATLGLISIFTSFITLGDTLKKIFWYDLKINHFQSWLLVVIIPLILFLLKFQDFIIIMEIVGSVTIAIEGFFIIALHQKIQSFNQHFFRSSYSVPGGHYLRWIILFLLMFGSFLSILEIISQFFNNH